MRYVTLRLAAAVLLLQAPAAAFGQEAGAAEPAQEAPAPAAARRVDEYGNLRHCDWSARLDNFAVELQNDPSVTGYVVSYNPPARHSYASRQLKSAHYYLTQSRGLEGLRLVMVDGGVRHDLEEGQTELWLVPRGAEPPVAAPAVESYAPGFSGKFDTFTADRNVYQQIYEMGTPPEAIARAEFAAKLKEQPDSVGYVVIRAPKGGVPGAWRGFARREEKLLGADGVDGSRIKILDGGYSEGREVEVDLWLLPAWAPPPPTPAEKLEAAFKSAARLHTADLDAEREDSERWMIENLAEFLRENPRATALLVAREPTPDEEIVWADVDEPGPAAASAPEATAAPEEAAASEAAAPEEAPAEVVGGEQAEAPEEKELTAKETAEEWKKQLLGKYGVEAHRVLVVEGPRVAWGTGRVNLWVVPEKGRLPDVRARDEDEEEREEYYGVARRPEARSASAAQPR